MISRKILLHSRSCIFMPQILLLATFEEGVSIYPKPSLRFCSTQFPEPIWRNGPAFCFLHIDMKFKRHIPSFDLKIMKILLFRVIKFDKRFLCCFIKSSEIKILTRYLSFISSNQISAKFKMKISMKKQ